MKLFTKDIDKKLFAQFPKGGELANQKVIAKIFNPYGRGVWYIINSDPNDPDYLWAIVNLFEVEVGSVSRKELESLRIKPFMLPLERDLSFSERNALEVYEGASQGQRFEDGGEMDDDEGVDLFEDYEDQPEEVSELLSTLEVEDYNYDTLNDLLSEMKKIGYTFEFGLDAEPYDLRKIGQKGKSEFYAKGGQTDSKFSVWVRKGASDDEEVVERNLTKRQAVKLMDKFFDEDKYYEVGMSDMMAKGGETEKRKMTLFESKSLSTPRKRVLTSSQDYDKELYIYEDGVLYDTDYMVNKTTSYRMSKIDLTILPLEYNQGKMAEGGKLDESTKMVLSQNKAIAHHTEELKRALQKDPNVEPWVIGKVGRAETDISDVTHYLDGRSEYAEGGKLGDSNYLCQMAEEYAEREFEKPVKKGQCVAKATKNGNLYKYTEVTVYFKDGTNHLFKEEDFEEFFDIDEFARGGKTPLMLKYVSPRDIAILKVTLDDGTKHSIKGESIISGEYKLAKGGKLSDNYVYIPKRNIDQVILKDGKTTDDKFNGFYVKKESLKSVESYGSEESDAVEQMKNAIAKVKSDKTLKALEITNILELGNTFAFQDAVEKAIKENKKSEAIDVYAEAINVQNKKYKFIIAKDLPEFGNPNAINLFPAKYVDVPSLKLKAIAKKSNIENNESWLKQINKFTSSDGAYRPAMTSIRFEGNSVVATNGTMLIHIFNDTKVETKEICVSNICKKFGGDKTSEDKTKSKYPQWSDIIINSFDRLENCEIDVNNFLKLAEFSVNQFTLSKDVNIPRIAIKTKDRNMIFNSELIITTMTTMKLLGLSKCKIHYDEIKRNSGVYFTNTDVTFDPLKNDFVLTMPMMNQETQQFGIDCETGKYVIVGDRYAKGGITFDDKVKAVENNLFGKEVPKKYRNSYGKTYNKAEAHESAKKIIGAQVKKYNKK
jgi:hypothetical protein